MIVPASNFLLKLLNSKLADYYIRSLGVTRNGGYFEYKPMFVEKFPAVHIDNELELVFLQADEKTADQLIYNLYGLETDEIGFIELQ